MSRPQPAACAPSCLLRATQGAAAPPAPAAPALPPPPPRHRRPGTERQTGRGRSPAGGQTRPGYRQRFGAIGETQGGSKSVPRVPPLCLAHPARRDRERLPPAKQEWGPLSPSRAPALPLHRAWVPAPSPGPATATPPPVPSSRRSRTAAPPAPAGNSHCSRAPTAAPGRGGGALFSQPAITHGLQTVPPAQRAAPVPRMKSWLRGSRPLLKLTPPARRLRGRHGRSRTYSPAKSDSGEGGHRRDDTARPRRWLAAAAANQSLKRGHASQ